MAQYRFDADELLKDELVLTKLDVGRRQLNSAVRMFFFESEGRTRSAQASAGGIASRGFRLPPARCTAPRDRHRGAIPRHVDADQRLSPRSREGRAAGERRRRHLRAQPPLGRRGTEPRRRDSHPLAQVGACVGRRSSSRSFHRRGDPHHELCGKRITLTPAHRRAPRKTRGDSPLALPCLGRHEPIRDALKAATEADPAVLQAGSKFRESPRQPNRKENDSFTRVWWTPSTSKGRPP